MNDLEVLNSQELLSLKGGGCWIYDSETDKWYWVETKGADPFPV